MLRGPGVRRPLPGCGEIQILYEETVGVLTLLSEDLGKSVEEVVGLLHRMRDEARGVPHNVMGSLEAQRCGGGLQGPRPDVLGVLRAAPPPRGPQGEPWGSGRFGRGSLEAGKNFSCGSSRASSPSPPASFLRAPFWWRNLFPRGVRCASYASRDLRPGFLCRPEMRT